MPIPNNKTLKKCIKKKTHMIKMILSTSSFGKLICVILIIHNLFFFSPTNCNPRNTEADIICGSKNHTNPENYSRAIREIMNHLYNDVRIKNWGMYNATSSVTKIYAFTQCVNDLPGKDCVSCFKTMNNILSKCLPSTSARIYLDGCYLRYDEHMFYHETIDMKSKQNIKCGQSNNKTEDDPMNDDLVVSEFEGKVRQVMENVTVKAKSNKGFGVVEDRGGVEGVYGMGQCWNTLSEKECLECLEGAQHMIEDCLPGNDGKALFPGCYARYSTKRLCSVTSHSQKTSDTSKIWYAVAGVSAAMATAMFFICLTIWGYKISISKEKESHKDCQNGLSLSQQKSKLSFKYEVLEKATDSFHESRKLGQGGSGSVFKGILPDGRTVAVKRLFFNTRQWVDEFFNEVDLSSAIQHKNLIKLLGCSIEGPESLLVYEYVPNKSLNQMVFPKDTETILNWQQRFDIVCGIAEGLAYLHGGCGAKIIHRDIKASNILLDENLTPKIADFGLARSVSSDRTHVSTGIAGTLGYMAPEYLVKGQLTEKADVYAFGVMVLEIVCGKKNSVFTTGSSSVLHSVWKDYKANRITESVDSVLKCDFDKNEASKVLQIGLLCTQASLTLRPSIPEVVQMLTRKDSEIPLPQQPPFLNASVLGSDNTATSMNFSVNHEQTAVMADISSFSTARSRSSYESICLSGIEGHQLRRYNNIA